MTIHRALMLSAIAITGLVGDVHAQSLSCPAVSSDTTFASTVFQQECSATTTTGCISKAGVNYDTGLTALTLPGSAGNFQSPPGAEIDENVLFAATADFDGDGWDDIFAADDTDKFFFLRNQTITCGVSPSGSASGTSSCSGTSTTAPTSQASTISAAWWANTSNVRKSAWRAPTDTAGTRINVKTGLSTSNSWTPMVAADFNGDGWPDVATLSYTYAPGSFPAPRWATAARLFLNTQNCKTSSTWCGFGKTCTGQATNGACTGITGVTFGTAYSETQLSCTTGGTAAKCPNYFPTFAVYDLRMPAANAALTIPLGPDAGTPVSSTGTTSSTPTTYKPGDFGPLSRPVTNMQAVDFDNDGDLDILYGHGPGNSSYLCPSTLCTVANKQFYVGIDVWLNDCAQSTKWSSTTKSCVGHVPQFYRTEGSCTGTSCNNSHTLFPSTAHNTTTLKPSDNAFFDYSSPYTHQSPVFAYEDIDKDGDYDLVLGSVGCCSTSSNSKYKLRIFKGTTGSSATHMLDTANPLQLSTSSTSYPGFEGALTGVFVHDFSGDGYPDIITGSDAVSYSGSIGGRARYWKHTGSASDPYGTGWPSCLAAANRDACTGCSNTCNPNPTTSLSQSCGSSSCTPNLSASPPQFPDFDNAMMLDYDHDPSKTEDVVFTNSASGSSKEFYVFPNRATQSTVAACGTVTSGTLSTPADESTVTGACITPQASFPNATSSIKYYLSNEDPANYIFACKQTQTGLSPATCCVSFTNITGKAIRWKAEFDSNSADDASANSCSLTGAASPSVSSVAANYTYNAASQHYRAGVVVSDGISYVGSFRQPGNRGSFYALAAGDGSKYYDAAAKIDAQSTRNLYTSDNVGTGISRINFSPTSPNTTLIARVGASTATEATSVINWVLSARFGLGSTLSRLGAVMSSTPAILTPPFRPSWYTYLSATEKALYDAFSTTNASRVPLAIFGSMDGVVHAIISKATDITNSKNGEEAWGFVPPYVAANMRSDYAASCTPNCATGTLSVTSYPDGSPTLLDYKKSNNTIATVALIADGAGGSSLTALDVTNTVDSSFTVTGPTPMWSQLPGDALAGKATSKPGVARVKVGGAEAYVVIAGTGINSADASKGKIVSGYNLETGALLWKFEMACPLTSDITVFETDDTGESGGPTIDGFADRAVFGDNCGNLYKIDPSVNLSGGYMDNTGFGNIALGTSNGVARFALFSTTQTGALGSGQQRPIVGAIGAKTDATTDMVMFFGTGGLESFDPSKRNEFYAVYAKDGSIRNKVTGTCTTGTTTLCEKFYGGVVITTDTVILQRTIDPVVTGQPGGCDYGSSKVQFLNASTFAQVDVVDSIGGTSIHATTGSLYGDANALYFATVSGEIKRIGTPRAATAGLDTANNNMNVTSGAAATTYESPFTLMGWRVVL